ncbi:MAG: metal-dependent hydrolase [Zetaproteobacteria bacterium CG_4_9_14_3_um_filter_49_83]|nr:MAG: metal-dependent hydrolase [Zetaproteobacteria bacterium CG1_02_49_23]PIQ33944.1 MAG: metal-dependent hydrolase [Zetaproteobacteria bacterium CG17_big_fil_post_rev_8_21_14_2_50_50_13]PIV30184.1 MAG: metal-dependent hydrolase [Zetaproteobacteria bacterium CG02_land_8_20_14_3_00_50_9]PIY54874.1 MAG: metal-dependent hydrolase [Zetaproteobacteria bacterium CG_4_10_14_0_8_um_filter_49_80]PJA35200.1 MAG: metal-dependent hydrolase [Zetaproteobacteria bacterium CG_4_9_14_3_um_filter_49_83]
MSPINHILTGWVIANASASFTCRERIAITLACVIPDLDGLGLIAEFLTKSSDNPLMWWSKYHHVLAHNLLFGLLLALTVYLLFKRNWLIAAFAFFSFHLHLIEDLISGRQSDGHAWTIQYMYPFSNQEWLWNGQWELDAWPNFVVVILLLLLTFHLAWKRGYSPLEMISKRVDEAFIVSLRERFGRP